MKITVKADTDNVRSFLLEIEGAVRRPKALCDALGRRLARELQGHFRNKNKTPNRLGGARTNFWKQVSDATVMTEATETGAVVTISEQRYAIHLFGGTIRPTGGRRFLTIPLVKEAHGKRVAEYEASTRRKLFVLPGRRVLMERSDQGTESTVSSEQVSVRGRAGNRSVGLRGRSRIRPVYALTPSVTITADPQAFPDMSALTDALQDTADKWTARTTKGGSQ